MDTKNGFRLKLTLENNNLPDDGLRVEREMVVDEETPWLGDLIENMIDSYKEALKPL